jgi:hypothetical protein
VAIKSGKISTGITQAPMTVENVKAAVQPLDVTIASPISIPLNKTLIIPGATVNVAVTLGSVVTVYGLEIAPGGSLNFNVANGRLAT